MRIDVENLSPIEKRVAIEIPWETVRDELDLAYKGLQKRARVKGFRAGHVPRKVLEQFYKGAVENEVVQRLVDDSFRKAVAEKDLFPISTPIVENRLELVQDAPFKFSAKVEVKPEVKVTGYQGVSVVRQVRAIDDAEVARELEQLREKAVVVEAVTDRTDAQKGDLAVIDFFGYVDGETFKGGKGINYTVEIGLGRMIPGFEDQLIGMKVSEHKEFQLVFPKTDGPEEVRGKTVEWKVDLKEIKHKILPELDDEFAKDLGEYESLDELKGKIKENLRTRDDARSKRQLRDKVMEKLVEGNTVDVPPAMVDRQLDFLLQEVEKIGKTNKDPAVQEAIRRLRDENRDRAKKQVAAMLLLEAVGREEKLEVTEAELEGRLGEIARQNKMAPKAVRQQLEREGRLDAVRYDIKQDKALDFVVKHAVVTDETVTGPIEEESSMGLDDDHDHDHDHAGHDHSGHDHSGHDHDHDHSGHDHDHDHHGHKHG
jgi:trigger factor